MTDTCSRGCLDLKSAEPPLIIVVGSGGVGKTTLAAAFGLRSAQNGIESLVMTFDPSHRLKDALALAGSDEVEVTGSHQGLLKASLLDPRETFDQLILRRSASPEAAQRILGNRFYDHLAGHLGGILEYMAVEKLYEIASSGRYQRIILDTPPTNEAIDFLEAPDRVVDFLDSGALRIALKRWFDSRGRFVGTPRIPLVSSGLERLLDRVVGIELLRDMSEFFLAFEPLFAGFKERARQVKALLASRQTLFVLVTGPSPNRVPDTLFFARTLLSKGYRLGPIIVNRVHPEVLPHRQMGVASGDDRSSSARAREVFTWLANRDRRAIQELRDLFEKQHELVHLPLVGFELGDLDRLAALGQLVESGGEEMPQCGEV